MNIATSYERNLFLCGTSNLCVL